MVTSATWRRDRQIIGRLRQVVDVARATDTVLFTGLGPSYDEFLTAIALPVSNRNDGPYKFGHLSVRRIVAGFARTFPDSKYKKGVFESAEIHLQKPPEGQTFFTRAQALARLAISEIHPCGNYGIENDGTDPQHRQCKLAGFSEAVFYKKNTSTHWSLCEAEIFNAAPLLMPVPTLRVTGWLLPSGGAMAEELRHP